MTDNVWYEHPDTTWTRNPNQTRLTMYSNKKGEVVYKRIYPEGNLIELWKEDGKKTKIKPKSFKNNWEGSKKAVDELRKLLGKNYRITYNKDDLTDKNKPVVKRNLKPQSVVREHKRTGTRGVRRHVRRR